MISPAVQFTQKGTVYTFQLTVTDSMGKSAIGMATVNYQGLSCRAILGPQVCDQPTERRLFHVFLGNDGLFGFVVSIDPTN
jgi:hypothetical protein